MSFFISPQARNHKTPLLEYGGSENTMFFIFQKHIHPFAHVSRLGVTRSEDVRFFILLTNSSQDSSIYKNLIISLS